MKIKKDFIVIKVPVYHGRILIKFCKDFIKEAHKIGVELRVDANSFDGLAFKIPKNGNWCILLSEKITPGVIAHECLHVVNYILGDSGVEVSVTNDEAQAYLLTWLVNKVHKIKIHL